MHVGHTQNFETSCETRRAPLLGRQNRCLRGTSLRFLGAPGAFCSWDPLWLLGCALHSILFQPKWEMQVFPHFPLEILIILTLNAIIVINVTEAGGGVWCRNPY